MRPLGALEHTVAVASRAVSMNFVMVADLSGPVGEDALRVALARAQARHPLLRSRIAETPGGGLAFAEGAGPIPLTVWDAAPGDLPAHCAAESMRQLPEADGPLVRAGLARTGDNISTLVLTFHHAIGDGTSGAWLVRDLLSALKAELAPLDWPAPLEAHLPLRARGWRGVLGFLGFVARMVGWQAQRGGVPRFRIPGAPQVPLGERRVVVARRDLSPARVAALVDAARAHGTTLLGLLGAALLRAAYRRGAGHRVGGLASPVNLRARLEPAVGEDVGLFITAIATVHRMSPMPDLWTLASEVRAEVTGQVERGDAFLALPVQGRALRWLAQRMGPPEVAAWRMLALGRRIWTEGVGLSNLGRLAVETRYGDVTLDAVGFFGAPTALGDLAMFTATLDGRLTAHLAGVAPVVPPDVVEAIADDWVAELSAV